jgi:hypothetical protein
MRRPRGPATLARVLVACALAVGGVIAALLVTQHESATRTPTTGMWAPITVSRPNVPIIAGGIPVDLDPMVHRNDFGQTLAPLPGTHRYQLTISNTSNLGTVNAFQWYPPTGVQIVKVVGSTAGRCTRTGLTGFGGALFPTLVLYPNILCDKLELKPPSCTCLGNGGAVTISFVTDKDIGGGEGDIRLRTATLVFDRIPAYLGPASTPPSSEAGG